MAHCLRTSSSTSSFTPNVPAEDSISDGVAATIASSGQGASQRGHDTEQDSHTAPDRLEQRNVNSGDLKDSAAFGH